MTFGARSIQLEIPVNVSSTTDTATDTLHREFEDHRVQDERHTPQIDWLFLTFLDQLRGRYRFHRGLGANLAIKALHYAFQYVLIHPALTAGAEEILFKPFQFSMLRDVLHRYLLA